MNEEDSNDWYCEATVSIVCGERRINNFIRSADLGILGGGNVEHLIIKYAPGVQVDKARVDKAMKKIRLELDEAKDEMEILSHEVLYVKKKYNG